MRPTKRGAGETKAPKPKPNLCPRSWRGIGGRVDNCIRKRRSSVPKMNEVISKRINSDPKLYDNAPSQGMESLLSACMTQ